MDEWRVNERFEDHLCSRHQETLSIPVYTYWPCAINTYTQMEGEQNKPPGVFGNLTERNAQVLRSEQCESFIEGTLETEESDECKPGPNTESKSAAALSPG